MIITIDGNPKLIREIMVDKCKVGKSNVLKDEVVFSQGIGTGCSNLISQSKEKACLVTFLDKEIGPVYEENLNNSFLLVDGIPIKERIQEEVVVRDSKDITSFLSPMPRLTREEINGIFLKVKGHMDGENILLLPLQEREELRGDFIAQCLAHAYEKAIPNVVCAKGDELEKIVEEKPYFLVVNKEDLESWTKLKINFSHEAQKAANILFDKGVGNVLIIHKESGAILCTKQGSFRLSFEKPLINRLNINFIATGVAVALERKYDWETTLKLSIAVGLVDRDFGRQPLDNAVLKEKMNLFTVKEI